ncbi:COP9 signalosome complex subunit 4 [Rhodotorula toruloides]|uniref:COP9 signalosome complex subunit 4 n=1 Tax=Rhodotorula toruloides TaxID=5286 RepID=A0A511KLC9_RHOTO|nr:COP9 signalosome complex subunit 4 [Rhodotorula toruloides]
MDAELERISNLPQKDKSQAYLALLDQTLSSSKSLPTDLSQWLSVVVGSDFPQIVARQVLDGYVAKLPEIRDRETRKELLNRSVQLLQPRVTSFEEQLCKLREHYGDLLEQDEEFPEAAKVLIGIPLESGSRPDDYKLRVYIRIVRLFLEEEDSTSADTYFNRASLLAHCAKDLETQLQFKLCQARMFDYSRRFGEASSKYHELSYVTALAEEERLQALGAAIVCAVLAPAGPVRSRLLASLYRDERSAQSEFYPILSKMFLDQMIRPAEVEAFSSKLQTHQLAKLPPTQAVVIADDAELETGKKGPETVLDRAMMEHNVLAASRVYNNITFGGLGLLLGLRPSAAEAMARTMIQQKRLKATLDQIDGLVLFDVDTREGGDAAVSNVAAQAAAGDDGADREEEAGNAPATKRWDMQIRQTLQLAESIAARCEVLLAEGGSSTASAPITASA